MMDVQYLMMRRVHVNSLLLLIKEREPINGDHHTTYRYHGSLSFELPYMDGIVGIV